MRSAIGSLGKHQSATACVAAVTPARLIASAQFVSMLLQTETSEMKLRAMIGSNPCMPRV